MKTGSQVIRIQPQAPLKPVIGAPCNGCGLCCLVEPCPLGVLLSGRRSGACHALQWSAPGARYQCGAMTEPQQVLQGALPSSLRWLVRPLAAVLARLAGRWVAAGIGCDSSIECAAVPIRDNGPPV